MVNHVDNRIKELNAAAGTELIKQFHPTLIKKDMYIRSIKEPELNHSKQHVKKHDNTPRATGSSTRRKNENIIGGQCKTNQSSKEIIIADQSVDQ
jgi:hypothetical protein